MTDVEAQPPLWLLVALTGAERAAALSALQAAGVECTDNLPGELLAAFAHRPRRGLTVVSVDARQGDGVADVTVPAGAHVLFLDADEGVLVRRQADTTVPHPCAAAGGGLASVAAERRLLGTLRAVAELVVDTTALTPVEVGRRVVEELRPRGLGSAAPALVCTVSSFGFKHGPQVEADWVVDVRFLPNPFWEPALRPRTGLDDDVSAYVLDNDDGRELVGRLRGLLGWVAERSQAGGRQRLHVAVGCTGGRHRSVAVAMALAAGLREDGVDVVVRHRDVDRPDPR